MQVLVARDSNNGVLVGVWWRRETGGIPSSVHDLQFIVSPMASEDLGCAAEHRMAQIGSQATWDDLVESLEMSTPYTLCWTAEELPDGSMPVLTLLTDSSEMRLAFWDRSAQ